HLRHPWFGLYPNLAEQAIHLLREMVLARQSKLYAWCIMPDHVHLLLQDESILEFMRLFKGRVTPRASKIDPGRRLWQRSFYDHGLRKEERLEDVATYIWQNPVRAEIVSDPADYFWSGSDVWPQWQEFFGRR
ncbi:MAG: transposase, partial [Proteobacteria bacterium]|nr:transposase [Pseudomonadota bacterium]